MTDYVQILVQPRDTIVYVEPQGLPGTVNYDFVPRFLSFEILDESSEWLIIHNQDSNQFITQLFDLEGNQFDSEIQRVDSNSIIIKHNFPITGVVNVYFPAKRTI